MEISGYLSLKQIVSNVLIDLFGKDDQARYFQYMAWAVRGFKKLKLNVIPQNKPVKLTVQYDPYSVTLPEDYMEFKAIGIQSNGKFVKFDYDPQMALTTTDDCGLITQDETEEAAEPINAMWYTYRLDEENQRVMLQGYPPLDEVILLYVSTGIHVGENTVVASKYVEALIAWIHYQRTKFNGGTQFDVAEAWRTYENEIRLIQKNKFDIDNMYAILFDVVDNKS